MIFQGFDWIFKTPMTYHILINLDVLPYTLKNFMSDIVSNFEYLLEISIIVFKNLQIQRFHVGYENDAWEKLDPASLICLNEEKLYRTERNLAWGNQNVLKHQI